MMKKVFTLSIASAMIFGCATISPVLEALRKDDAPQAAKAQTLTRAAVIEANVAMIKYSLGQEDKVGNYLLAGALNNGVVSYVSGPRSIAALRGGLLVNTYGQGSDLLNVRINPADPIQNQRRLAEWPTSVKRSYVFPGDGLDGKTLNVSCDYQIGAPANIEILEIVLQTRLISEHCQGEGAKFSNKYYVDDAGFVWKSEQYAGDLPYMPIVEIVEPLD